jgi:hypothetical protein
MMSVGSIISGFSNLVFSKPDIEAMAKKRRKFCNGCEKSNFGKSRLCLKRKGGCGCVLSLKTRVPDEECPELNWIAQ